MRIYKKDQTEFSPPASFLESEAPLKFALRAQNKKKWYKCRECCCGSSFYCIHNVILQTIVKSLPVIPDYGRAAMHAKVSQKTFHSQPPAKADASVLVRAHWGVKSQAKVGRT